MEEGNGTSSRPRPPMLHTQLGDSSITPLRKPPLSSFISSIAFQGFEQEVIQNRDYPLHQIL